MAGEDEKLQSPEQCDGILKYICHPLLTESKKDDKISANK